MIAHASPSIRRVTRPRTWAIRPGCSWSATDSDTRGSSARLRAFCDPGPSGTRSVRPRAQPRWERHAACRQPSRWRRVRGWGVRGARVLHRAVTSCRVPLLSRSRHWPGTDAAPCWTTPQRRTHRWRCVATAQRDAHGPPLTARLPPPVRPSLLDSSSRRSGHPPRSVRGHATTGPGPTSPLPRKTAARAASECRPLA